MMEIDVKLTERLRNQAGKLRTHNEPGAWDRLSVVETPWILDFMDAAAQAADALDQKDAEIEALRKQVAGLRKTLGEAAEHICFYGPLEHGGDDIVAAYDDLMDAATDDLAGYVLVDRETLLTWAARAEDVGGELNRKEIGNASARCYSLAANIRAAREPQP